MPEVWTSLLLGEGCGVGSPEPATIGSGVFGTFAAPLKTVAQIIKAQSGNHFLTRRLQPLPLNPRIKMALTRMLRTAMLTS